MIVSRQNQKIKDIRRLRRCKDDRSLLEGPHLVGEALAAGLRPELVIASPDFLHTEEGTRLVSQVPELVIEASLDLIEYVCDSDSPRGVVAVVSLPRGGLDSVPVVKGGLYVYVDGIQDPGNLGALIRVAEGFAANGVVLAPGTAHPNHPRALRASAGSLLRTPVFCGVAANHLHERLLSASPEWLVLSPRGGIEINQLESPKGVVLVVGAEGPGVSPDVLALPHTSVTIPLAPTVESLNSTVSAAIALYELGSGRNRRS